MIKLILFDLDGTLINAGGAGRIALNKTVKQLYGKDNICTAGLLAGRTDRDNFRQAFILAEGRKPSKNDISKMEKIYLELLPYELRKAVKNKKYFKIRGIEKFLKQLAELKNVMLGLGTGNLKKGAFIKLEPSGFTKYFLFGGFGCDGYERASMLKKAVRRAEKIIGRKIKPFEVYIIGDTHKDVYAGKQNGYHTGAVTCGFDSEEELRISGPEILEKDFSDLKPWFIWLGIKTYPKSVKRRCYICPDNPIEHIHFAHTKSKWQT